MITVLSVKEMCCPVEGRAVEKALRAMEGVEEILFDYAARTVRVTHGTVAVEALVREVEKLGMTACVSEAAKSEAPAISIRVPEMDCPVEAAQIEKAFAAAGLPKATFDTERRVVRVAASFEAAKAAIESCGYRAELLREPSGRIVFKVPDMDCPVEVAEIQKALKKRGIEGAECDTEARTVTLSGDEATAKTVKEAIESCGYEAERIRTSSGRIVFKVPDMDCPVEVAEIQKALKKCGIEGAECNTESRTVTIAGDEATAEAVKAAIESCGYEATRVEVKRKAAAPEADPIPWGRYITALVIGLLSEAVELWSHYAAESLPVSVETASWASIVFALIAIALAGLATFRSGLTALRHGNLNMNALMSVAVVGGVLIGAWPEAAMVMTLFQISESIEQLAMNRARNSIRDLMSVAPEKAMVRQADGRYVEEAVAEVLPGAVVRVSPGDRVPLDGKIRQDFEGRDVAGRIHGDGRRSARGKGRKRDRLGGNREPHGHDRSARHGGRDRQSYGAHHRRRRKRAVREVSGAALRRPLRDDLYAARLRRGPGRRDRSAAFLRRLGRLVLQGALPPRHRLPLRTRDLHPGHGGLGPCDGHALRPSREGRLVP